MPTKKRAAIEAWRLAVLAASGDEREFLAFALELLASPQRLHREAALEALVERPVPAARATLRELFASFDANGPKLDQGGKQRASILRYLLASPDSRDADVGVMASVRREIVMGDDTTAELRALGLQLLATIAPDLFPYFAIERLQDADAQDCAQRDDGEPSTTAIRLLAATGQFPVLYQWLRGDGQSSRNLVRAFEAFQDAPPAILGRFVEEAVGSAVARNDEALCIALAESIVHLELEGSYAHIAMMMSAKISDDLYHYLAVLLASTNRRPLLEILQSQLRRGRRPALVVEALRIRTTPEQAEILRRWDEGDLGEER